MDDDDDSEPLFICQITAYPCEGDLSYLCEEYGCARKGGLSPRSEENLRGGSAFRHRADVRHESIAVRIRS
jgi:hypothetical protein